MKQRLTAFFDRHAYKLAIAACFPFVTWGYGWRIGIGCTLLLFLALVFFEAGENGEEETN